MEPPFKLPFEAHTFMERTDRQTHTHTHTHRCAIMFQGARLGPDGHQTLGNKHSWSSSPSLSVCVYRGESVVDLSFPFLPQIPRVLIRGTLHWRPIWLAHALTILVFSVSSGWLRLLQQVSCLLCVIFFSSSTFPTFPCLSLLSQAPPPFPSVLFSVTLYLSLSSSYPVSGHPSFGSARLSCLLHVLSHSLKGKEFFHSPFRSLCVAAVVLLFFQSTVLMAHQKQLVLPDTFSGRSHA